MVTHTHLVSNSRCNSNSSDGLWSLCHTVSHCITKPNGISIVIGEGDLDIIIPVNLFMNIFIHFFKCFSCLLSLLNISISGQGMFMLLLTSPFHQPPSPLTARWVDLLCCSLCSGQVMDEWIFVNFTTYALQTQHYMNK